MEHKRRIPWGKQWPELQTEREQVEMEISEYSEHGSSGRWMCVERKP